MITSQHWNTFINLHVSPKIDSNLLHFHSCNNDNIDPSKLLELSHFLVITDNPLKFKCKTSQSSQPGRKAIIWYKQQFLFHQPSSLCCCMANIWNTLLCLILNLTAAKLLGFFIKLSMSTTLTHILQLTRLFLCKHELVRHSKHHVETMYF